MRTQPAVSKEQFSKANARKAAQSAASTPATPGNPPQLQTSKARQRLQRRQAPQHEHWRASAVHN